MSDLIKGLEEYFEKTPKKQLEQELKDLEKYDQYGPLVNLSYLMHKRKKLVKKQLSREELYEELRNLVKNADQNGNYIGLGGHFGGIDMNIRAMRLSPKGEHEDEVRDVEFLCDDFVWYDNILQCEDLFPDKCLNSILLNISHGNCFYASYDDLSKALFGKKR